jgi:hypothetical protein
MLESNDRSTTVIIAIALRLKKIHLADREREGDCAIVLEHTIIPI